MKKLIFFIFTLCLFISGCSDISISIEHTDNQNQFIQNENYTTLQVEDIPSYDGKPYIVINDNIPVFSSSELTTKAYEYYSPLDQYNRCGITIASIGKEIMPTSKREDIGHIKPSGWHSVRYDFVEGKSLYNRCHLIGFQLTGENDNERNLITGTRTMNTKGMLPFENMIADYVKETNNHVAYRVTPIYDGNNLVASGVHMEGYSIEDQGEGICFSVYCYNVEPGVIIDYKTGESYTNTNNTDSEESTYILNINNKKIHKTNCRHIETIKKENKKKIKDTLKHLLEQGYVRCGGCF